MQTPTSRNRQMEPAIFEFELDQLTTSARIKLDGSFLPAEQDRQTGLAMCEGLIDILAALFTVSGRHLRSPKRHGMQVARVRQIGMYVAHVALRINMGIISAGFARDKSTVVHACHLIEDMRDDEDFDSVVSRVETIACAAFKFGLTQTNGDPE